MVVPRLATEMAAAEQWKAKPWVAGMMKQNRSHARVAASVRRLFPERVLIQPVPVCSLNHGALRGSRIILRAPEHRSLRGRHCRGLKRQHDFHLLAARRVQLSAWPDLDHCS